MSSRKELLKRSLGISDYPWSSDDDLETTLSVAAEEAILHRPSTETLSNESNAPGTSGSSSQQPLQQPQQTHQHHRQREQQQMQSQLNPPSRRSQSRIDREIFWSILNTPPNQISSSSTRMRSGEIPVSYVSRVNHIPSSEGRRRGERPDVQRILAFKRLTRNLGSLRHRGTITGVIPVTRVNPGVIPDPSSSIRINRHYPCRRFVRTGPFRAGLQPPYVELSPEAGAGRRQSRNSPDGEERQLAPAPQPATHDQPAQIEVNNNPIPPAGDAAMLNEQMNVGPDVQMEDNLEPEANNNSGANLPREGRIVAIELDSSDGQGIVNGHLVRDVRELRSALLGLRSAEARAAASAEVLEAMRDTRAGETRSVGVDAREAPAADARAAGADVLDAPGPSGSRFANMPSTSDADLTAALTPKIIIIKKKHRSDADASADPQTVKEFNQNLLRLLECPVCLEWMEPPMSQCRRGHLVCGRCRARLASCPVCRTTFSSVRNRAMEGVAEMLRYPCRHGCGREVRLRRRAPHEASCAARKYNCPAPACADALPLPRAQLAAHFQSSERPPGENSPQPDLSGRGQPIMDDGGQPVVGESDQPVISGVGQPVVGESDQPVVDGGGQSAPSTQAEEVLLEPFNPYYVDLSNSVIIEPPDWPFGRERVYLETLRRVMINLATETSLLRQYFPQQDEDGGQPTMPGQSHDEQGALPNQDGVQPIVPAQSYDGLAALPNQDGGQPTVPAQSHDGQAALTNQDGGQPTVPAQSYDGQSALLHQDGGQPTLSAQSQEGQAALLNQDGGLPTVPPQSHDGHAALFHQDGGQPTVSVQSHDRQAALPHHDGGQPTAPAQFHYGHAALPYQDGGQPTVPAQSHNGQAALPHHDGGQPTAPAQFHYGQAALPYQDGGQPTVPAQNYDRQAALPDQDGGQPNMQLIGLGVNYHDLIRYINEEMLNESRHLTIMKIGRRHRFTMKVNSELHENWLILAMEEYFHLRIDVDIRTWGVIVYVSYIGPKCDAKNFTYEVTIDGQHNQRKLAYARTTHSDMESSSLNMGRQDCFQLTLDQALNFIRYKNRHCDADRYLDFNVEISKVERPAGVPRDDSDS